MVSKGYIEGWADGEGRVEVIDIPGRRGLRQPIGNATVVNYAYDPAVLSKDLESEYAAIESAGIPIIKRLRNGGDSMDEKDMNALVAFLDMHLDRGRYADQAKVRTPALVLKDDGKVEAVELSLGDRLLLAQALPDVTRLKKLGLAEWPWKLLETEGLPTGDGAVLLWAAAERADLCTVSFPLSPTRLLVIGRDLPDGIPFLHRLTANCRRWIIGAPGTLNLDWAAERDNSD